MPHAEDWEKAKRLCAFLPEELLAQICDFMGLIGTPEYCARRLQELEASGLDHLYLMTGATYEFAHRSFEPLKKRFSRPWPQRRSLVPDFSLGESTSNSASLDQEKVV